MKKYFILFLLIFISIFSFSQKRGNLFTVPNDTTQFIVTQPAGTIILDLGSKKTYLLDSMALGTATINTSYTTLIGGDTVSFADSSIYSLGAGNSDSLGGQVPLFYEDSLYIVINGVGSWYGMNDSVDIATDTAVYSDTAYYAYDADSLAGLSPTTYKDTIYMDINGTGAWYGQGDSVTITADSVVYAGNSDSLGGEVPQYYRDSIYLDISGTGSWYGMGDSATITADSVVYAGDADSLGGLVASYYQDDILYINGVHYSIKDTVTISTIDTASIALQLGYSGSYFPAWADTIHFLDGTFLSTGSGGGRSLIIGATRTYTSIAQAMDSIHLWGTGYQGWQLDCEADARLDSATFQKYDVISIFGTGDNSTVLTCNSNDAFYIPDSTSIYFFNLKIICNAANKACIRYDSLMYGTAFNENLTLDNTSNAGYCIRADKSQYIFNHNILVEGGLLHYDSVNYSSNALFQSTVTSQDAAHFHYCNNTIGTIVNTNFSAVALSAGSQAVINDFSTLFYSSVLLSSDSYCYHSSGVSTSYIDGGYSNAASANEIYIEAYGTSGGNDILMLGAGLYYTAITNGDTKLNVAKSDEVDNKSSVTGTTVTAALNTLLSSSYTKAGTLSLSSPLSAPYGSYTVPSIYGGTSNGSGIWFGSTPYYETGITCSGVAKFTCYPNWTYIFNDLVLSSDTFSMTDITRTFLETQIIAKEYNSSDTTYFWHDQSVYNAGTFVFDVTKISRPFYFNDALITRTLTPKDSGISNLGSASKYYHKLYIDTGYVGNDLIVGGTITVGGVTVVEDSSQKTVVYIEDSLVKCFYGETSLDNATAYARANTKAYGVRTYCDTLTPTTNCLSPNLRFLDLGNAYISTTKSGALFSASKYTNDVNILGNSTISSTNEVFLRDTGSTAININLEFNKWTSSGSNSTISFDSSGVAKTNNMGVVNIKGWVTASGSHAIKRTNCVISELNINGDVTSTAGYALNSAIGNSATVQYTNIRSNVFTGATGTATGLYYTTTASTYTYLDADMSYSTNPVVNVASSVRQSSDVYLKGYFVNSTFTNNSINMFKVDGTIVGTLKLAGTTSNNFTGLMVINSDLDEVTQIDSNSLATNLSVDFNGSIYNYAACYWYPSAGHIWNINGSISTYAGIYIDGLSNKGLVRLNPSCNVITQTSTFLYYLFVQNNSALEVNCKMTKNNNYYANSTCPIVKHSGGTLIVNPSAQLDNKNVKYYNNSTSIIFPGSSCISTNGSGNVYLNGGRLIAANDTASGFEIQGHSVNDTTITCNLYNYGNWFTNKQYECVSNVMPVGTPPSSYDWSAAPDTFTINVNGAGATKITLNANCADRVAMISHINTQLAAAGITTAYTYLAHSGDYIYLRTNTKGINTSIVLSNGNGTACTTLQWRTGTYSVTLTPIEATGGQEIYNANYK